MNPQSASVIDATESPAGLLSSSAVEFVEALGKACEIVRAGRRPELVVIHLERLKERALLRFEAGVTQPRNLDEVLDGYALAFSVSLSQILRQTADLLEMTPTEVESLLPETTQAVEQATNGPAAKPRGAKKRKAA